MAKEKGAFQTFWTSLPGIFTGIAAILSAVGGIVALGLASGGTSTTTISNQAVTTPVTTSGLTSCGGGNGLSVNAVTSCPFASNVRDAYQNAGGAATVQAFSPTTGKTYTMTCVSQSGGIDCTGGTNAEVFFSG